MAWKIATDPNAPAPPRVHSPTRCMNCGHEKSEHDDSVGCLVEGGTKFISNDEGQSLRACSCTAYVAPQAEGANA